MPRLTIANINKAIAQYGIALHKGEGYFYFYDLDESAECNADRIPSVYSCHLSTYTLDGWIRYVKSALSIA